MKSAEPFCKKTTKMGTERAKIIDPGSIVTAKWVRMITILITKNLNGAAVEIGGLERKGENPRSHYGNSTY